MKGSKKDIMWRIYIVYFVVFAMGASIIGRIFYIQTFEDEKWETMAKEQSIKRVKIESSRGNIYSDDYSLLATSIPLFDIYWDGKVIAPDTFYRKINKLSQQFANIFPDETPISFKQRMQLAYSSGRRYYKIRTKVEYSQLKKIKSLPIFNMGQFKGGLIVEEYSVRKRPYKDLAMRTIGIYNTFLKKYDVGLEGAYNNYLKGEDGIKIVQRTTGGWKTSNIVDNTIREPKNGFDIITNININIQDVAESSLHRVLEEHQADWGCAVLMEVKTGAIKAIVNLNHDTTNHIYYEGFNHAIGTASTPGSTFKLATILVALEDDKVKFDQVIHTGGGRISYNGSKMIDAKTGGYGDLTVKQVFEHSSNVGVFKIALSSYEKNPQQFIDGLYALGINKPLGVEIKGERAPFIKDTHHKSWSKMSLPWMSIGYELTMTPLQILTLYNSIANNGVMVKPLFVKEIRNANEVIKSYKTVVINSQVASKKVIKEAREMCEGVVTEGTATLLKNSPYTMAGKTGTAQIYTGNYDNNSYIASFVGYFPADNPKYSCIVVVYNPRKGLYYAAQVAVPVFKDIADKIYASELNIQEKVKDDSIFEIPSSKVGIGREVAGIYSKLGFVDKSFAPLEDKWINASKKDSAIVKTERIIKDGLVPDVTNMNTRDAVFLLEQMGLKVSISGRGKVVEQSIAPGQSIIKGSKISLKLNDK